MQLLSAVILETPHLSLRYLELDVIKPRVTSDYLWLSGQTIEPIVNEAPVIVFILKSSIGFEYAS
jgi:hypothetical protein